MRSALRTAGALAAVTVLLAGCTDDPPDPDPAESSAAVADALRDASAGEAADTLPEVVAVVAEESAPLPGDQSAAVLALLGAHPDALRAAAGPDAPGMAEPSVALDEKVLDALVAAGGDDGAADDFRTAYLHYVRDGVERAIADSDGTWYDTRDVIDEVWIAPSAEVLGAVEAGCDQSGDSCSDRVDRADAQLQDALDEATYAAIPARLLPKTFLAGGERVPMAGWSTRQRDDWQRLHDTTLLPLSTGEVERAAYARMRSTGA